MTQRQANLLLKHGATALLVLAAAVAALGLFLPLRSMTPRQTGSSAAPGGSHAAVASAGSTLDSFEPLFNRQLRTALGGAPANLSPAPDPSPQPASAPPSLAFVGTVGDSLAMIRSADGSVAVVAVGEQIAGAQLLAIRPTQVDLRTSDGTFSLSKALETPDDSGTPAGAATDAPSTNFAHGY